MEVSVGGIDILTPECEDDIPLESVAPLFESLDEEN